MKNKDKLENTPAEQPAVPSDTAEQLAYKLSGVYRVIKFVIPGLIIVAVILPFVATYTFLVYSTTAIPTSTYLIAEWLFRAMFLIVFIAFIFAVFAVIRVTIAIIKVYRSPPDEVRNDGTEEEIKEERKG